MIIVLKNLTKLFVNFINDNVFACHNAPLGKRKHAVHLNDISLGFSVCLRKHSREGSGLHISVCLKLSQISLNPELC